MGVRVKSKLEIHIRYEARICSELYLAEDSYFVSSDLTGPDCQKWVKTCV